MSDFAMRNHASKRLKGARASGSDLPVAWLGHGGRLPRTVQGGIETIQGRMDVLKQRRPLNAKRKREMNMILWIPARHAESPQAIVSGWQGLPKASCQAIGRV